MADWQNRLYFGDNLDILRDYIPTASVDLIYLDPPFNSKATYNVLFAEKSGEASAAQITAFEDTWHWGLESEAAFHEVVTAGPKKLADLLAGKALEYPRLATATFKKAPRQHKGPFPENQQGQLKL
ncbi:MAG: hypothetical protein A2Y80_00110 [Deltaproteobacteria bacterium RBG_13_58_19]|nr:MAG: hypothetical protein A2Y80_00110 [Deltaproteobacteria bacterium RBG_13_58_19]